MNPDIELIFPALFVECTDEEYDINLPPSTGNEYLRRVRLEAAQCPDIVVANIDSSRFTVRQTIKVTNEKGCQPAPMGYAPSLAWQRQQVADFSDMRMTLGLYKARSEKAKTKRKPLFKLPRMEDDVGWCRLCFGNKFQRQLAKRSQSSDVAMDEDGVNAETVLTEREGSNADGMLPFVSFVSHMSQPLVEQVLDYHICWFEATGFTREQGCWFYALLVALEKPLNPDTCSSLRSLVRMCANLRASLADTDYRLPHLNLLICLVTRYFDQSDLADSGN